MDWKQKLTSRKFWAAVVNFVTQLMIAFGAAESAAVQVAAVIMAGAGVVAYIIGEGMADAAGAAGDVHVNRPGDGVLYVDATNDMLVDDGK